LGLSLLGTSDIPAIFSEKIVAKSQVIKTSGKSRVFNSDESIYQAFFLQLELVELIPLPVIRFLRRVFQI